MKSAPGVPLTIAELQLSSPLPSPSRQSVLNITTTHHHHQHNITTSSSSSSNATHITTLYNNNMTTTTFDPAFISKTEATSMLLSPVQFDAPLAASHNHYSSNLYPIAKMATPQAMKKFKFIMNGIPGIIEEISTVHPSHHHHQQQQQHQVLSSTNTQARKRSASIWDDERSFKRTELDTNEAPDHITNGTTNLPLPIISSNSITTTTTTTNNTTSTNTTMMMMPNTSPNNLVENMPDSPNSALPSPVSDLDESFYSIQEELQDEDQIKDQDVIMMSPTTEPIQEQITMDIANLMETFDQLPDTIQTYFMFQLLKRSPREALCLANATIMQALKLDILTGVPHNIALDILSFLDVKSLCRASSVNKTWHTLISQASSLWQLKMKQAEFHPSPRELATGNYYKIVRRHTVMRRNWRLNRHTKLLLEGHEEDLVTCLQFDEEKIITTGSDDHRINVYDIKTGVWKCDLKGHEGGVWALQYVGNTLVTGSIDRTIRVWDIESGRCRFILRGHSSTVRCLKIVMPEAILQLDGSVRMEPSEPIIVSGSRDMSIRVWRLPDLEKEPHRDLSTCQEDDLVSHEFLKFKLAQHEHSVRDLAVYGNTLVSGSYDNNVIVWDLATGKSLYTLKGHTMKVYCVAIDPKRRHCISGSLDASVRIWGLDDGECKYVLQGHSILVGLLGLVDDCLVSAAADATLRIWDPSNGDRLHILAGVTGHQGPITSFQHDKFKIISGSEGGVKMWDTKTGALLHDLVEGATSIWRVSFDERRCIAAVKNENKTQLVVLDYGVYGLEGDDND